MKKSLFLLILFGQILSITEVTSYEKQTLTFTHKSNLDKSIIVEFYGETFSSPIEIFPPSTSVEYDLEIKNIIDFFYRSYRTGIKGDDDKMLELWHPDDRSSVAKRLGDNFFKDISQPYYKKIVKQGLTRIIKYGDYYLCYVTTESKNKAGSINMPIVRVIALIQEKGKFFRTEGLNNNKFMIISHGIDKNNHRYHTETLKLFPLD
jgi:hypothetical protein